MKVRILRDNTQVRFEKGKVIEVTEGEAKRLLSLGLCVLDKKEKKASK